MSTFFRLSIILVFFLYYTIIHSATDGTPTSEDGFGGTTVLVEGEDDSNDLGERTDRLSVEAFYSCESTHVSEGEGAVRDNARHPSFLLGNEPYPPYQGVLGDDFPSDNAGQSIPPSQIGTVDSNLEGRRVPAPRRKSFQHADEEAGEIPDMAPYNPSACVRCFKRGVVAVADVASVSCKILGGLCGVSLCAAVGDYTVGGTFLSAETQAQVALLSGAGVAVFTKLDTLLQQVKLRDELHLIGYVARDEFNDARERHYPDCIYTQEEIVRYLSRNNGFVTLPRSSGYLFRSFLFNSMCVLESILGITWAITGGLASITTTSGMVGKDLIGLREMDHYRTLTIILTSSTGVIVLLDKNRLRLKSYCEDWLFNYQMLLRYFIYIQGIPADNIYDQTRPVPEEFIGSDLQIQMQNAANLTGGGGVV